MAFSLQCQCPLPTTGAMSISNCYTYLRLYPLFAMKVCIRDQVSCYNLQCTRNITIRKQFKDGSSLSHLQLPAEVPWSIAKKDQG